MRKIRHGRRGERGVAAVEFALVFTLIFLPLVLGGIDFGWYFFVSETVTNAAREGARAGSVVDPAPINAGFAKSQAESTATNYLTTGGLTKPATVNAWPTWVNGAPAIQVDIQYPVGSLTGFFSWIEGLSVTKAHAVMRWQ
jgi:Flp pilus assembly protein TadG